MKEEMLNGNRASGNGSRQIVATILQLHRVEESKTIVPHKLWRQFQKYPHSPFNYSTGLVFLSMPHNIIGGQGAGDMATIDQEAREHIILIVGLTNDGYNHWGGSTMDVSSPIPVIVIHSFGV